MLAFGRCNSFTVVIRTKPSLVARVRGDRPTKTKMPPDPNLIVQTVLSWVIPGIVIIVLGVPVVRLITRWLEPKPVPPRELTTISARLEGIEAAVEAIAVEVERISEAQRFSAKLQSEQQRPSLTSAGESPGSPT